MRLLLIGGLLALIGSALDRGPETIEICAANIRNSTATCFDAVSGKPTADEHIKEVHFVHALFLSGSAATRSIAANNPVDASGRLV